LRLNFVKIYDGSHDHKILKKKKEKKNMTKTLKIEGMMCMHCEAHVKKALEGLDGVLSAEVSFKTGEAIVTLEKEVNDDILKKTVTDEGYTVKEIN
ncbi:MAG: heavy-metal-associated domain-containing protein, partial [Erysipelotrichaceae bacterium]